MKKNSKDFATREKRNSETQKIKSEIGKMEIEIYDTLFPKIFPTTYYAKLQLRHKPTGLIYCYCWLMGTAYYYEIAAKEQALYREALKFRNCLLKNSDLEELPINTNLKYRRISRKINTVDDQMRGKKLLVSLDLVYADCLHLISANGKLHSGYKNIRKIK